MKFKPTSEQVSTATFYFGVGANVLATAMNLQVHAWISVGFCAAIVSMLFFLRPVFLRYNAWLDNRIGEAEARRKTAEFLLAETKRQIEAGRVHIEIDVQGERTH